MLIVDLISNFITSFTSLTQISLNFQRLQLQHDDAHTAYNYIVKKLGSGGGRSGVVTRTPKPSWDPCVAGSSWAVVTPLR